LEEPADDQPTRILLLRATHCRLRGRPNPGFNVQARFRQEQVVIAGRTAEYIRIGDEGGQARFRFCPDCGATLYWHHPGGEGFVAVAVGAFADPGFPPPTFSVYAERRHP
jgi:hypothetical protein